ncbi:uncharacterized protein LOC128736395 [Sabethes cyaneus]|uniref:uncharacterized protein LOC128736395 n=1 Tax=Sabethes cyaneus TaxID=53552 RepID=UPI00237D70EF|nr:uncharacterized protein LOC128736395 [Sabethes cyaneus]
MLSHWLKIVCIVGCFGGALSLYAPIAVGANGLVVIGRIAQQTATVLTTYNNTLNTARSQIFVRLNDLMGWVNVTYTALNKTWGANQTNLRDFVENLKEFNTTVGYGESNIVWTIGYDLGYLVQALDRGLDPILQYYRMLLEQMAYTANVDNCTLRNASQMADVPNRLFKLAQCLQMESNAVTAALPAVLNMISVVKLDFVSLVDQLKSCHPLATDCQNWYFDEIYSEHSAGMQMLSLVMQFISSAFYDAFNRNQFCSTLVEHDIQETLHNLQNTFSLCTSPPWP